MSKENEGSLHMTEPRKPREFWVVPKLFSDNGFAWGKKVDVDTCGFNIKTIHVREVMPGIANSEAMDLMNQKLDRTQRALQKAKNWLRRYGGFPTAQILKEIEAIERGEG